jgi:hypothetical protein
MSKAIVTYGSVEEQGIASGITFTLGVALSEAPTATVTVSRSITSGKFTTNFSSLTFTTSNWMTPQALILTAGGTTAGLETDTLTLSASGGGFDSVTKSLYVPVLKAGVYGGTSTVATWMSNLTKVGSWSEIFTSSVSTKRQRFRDLVFQGHGDTSNFPTGVNTAKTTGYTGAMHQMASTDLSNFSSIDELTFVRLGLTHKGYHIHSSVTAVNKLLFVCMGHGVTGNTENTVDVVNAFLVLGWDVFTIAMPLNIINTNSYGYASGTTGHTQMGAALDSSSFSSMGLFFFDKIQAMNYIKANYSYSEIDATGASGGGFTTILWKALDSRINKIAPRAGLAIRSYYPQGYTGLDYECGGTRYTNYNTTSQCWALYNEIDSMSHILLAASSGKVSLVHNPYGFDINFFMGFSITENRLSVLASSLGGAYKQVINNSASETLDQFYASDIVLIKIELGA